MAHLGAIGYPLHPPEKYKRIPKAPFFFWGFFLIDCRSIPRDSGVSKFYDEIQDQSISYLGSNLLFHSPAFLPSQKIYADSFPNGFYLHLSNRACSKKTTVRSRNNLGLADTTYSRSTFHVSLTVPNHAVLCRPPEPRHPSPTTEPTPESCTSA